MFSGWLFKIFVFYCKNVVVLGTFCLSECLECERLGFAFFFFYCFSDKILK